MVFAFPVAPPFAAALTAFLAPLLVFILFVALDMWAVTRSLALEIFDFVAARLAFLGLVLAAHTDLTEAPGRLLQLSYQKTG